MDWMTTTIPLGALFWAASWWTWVISAMMFAAVFLLVVAVFSQPGQIEMSYQRQAAIATGHTDRKTVFENPLLRPILWIFLSMASHLNLPQVKRWLGRQLIAAGSPNYCTPEEYLALAMFNGLGLGVLFELFYFLLQRQLSLSILLLGVVIGLTLTLYQIVERAGKRLRNITRQLPYALDLVSLAMGAGATFVEAIQTIVRGEDSDAEADLNTELRALLAEIELGTTRREALENLAGRVPLSQVRAIVASIMQAEELGTPLGTVLHDQATLLRMQRSTRAENKAASASVRILVPCLLLVMAVILTIFGPAIIRAMEGGLF